MVKMLKQVQHDDPKDYLVFSVSLRPQTFSRSETLQLGEVHTIKDQKHLIRGSLTDLSERLPKNFYRTHRSFTINVDHMEAINSAYVLMNNEQIPIGKNYRDDLLKKIRVE